MSPTCGGLRSSGAARRIARHGRTWPSSPITGFPNRASSTPGPTSASPSNTQGGSRMRESRTYGSVRGALSNERPYRDPYFLLAERHRPGALRRVDHQRRLADGIAGGGESDEVIGEDVRQG